MIFASWKLNLKWSIFNQIFQVSTPPCWGSPISNSGLQKTNQRPPKKKIMRETRDELANERSVHNEKKNTNTIEHLLTLKTEQNLFSLNANRAGLGSHSKWTNFVQERIRAFCLVTGFNKRHYEDRFHRIVKINSQNKRENHSCGGGYGSELTFRKNKKNFKPTIAAKFSETSFI